MDFDSVIGVIGLKAAGKDTFCRYAERRFGYATVRISDAVRAEAAQRDLQDPAVVQLQTIGDEAKRRTGNAAFWAERAVALAQERGHRLLLVNGIRNPAEVVYLQRAFGNRCTLVGITAPTLLRAGRFRARGQAGDPASLADFLAVDDRDRGIGQPPDGQQVDRCLALVPWPHLLVNDGERAAFERSIERFFANVSVL